jgi:hypothetical protein
MAHGGDPNFDLVVGKNVITQGLAEFERIRNFFFLFGRGGRIMFACITITFHLRLCS